MQKTLIVRLRNWIGDVVLGIPALQALESAGYSPVLVGKRWAKDLFEGYGWPTHQRTEGFWQATAQYRTIAEYARAGEPGFDTHINALTFATSFSSALEMRVAGLRACGYAYEGRGMFLANAPTIKLGVHALTSYWELAQHLIGTHNPPPKNIQLRLSENHRRQADAALQSAKVGSDYVLVCPFAGGTFEKLDKRWPLFSAYVKELSRSLASSKRRIVIVPGPGEEPVAQIHFPDAVMLTGVGVGAYAALIERAALTISNDTGPGHIAAALDRPLVSVLGPTKPEQWAPWGPSAIIIRRWPGWPTVAEVMQTTLSLLRK
jgi:heptosyltransferase II